jgi:hypothetical protein
MASIQNVVLYIKNGMVDNVTCKPIARQRPQHTHGPTRNNGTTGLCNPLLENGSVNTISRMRNDVTPTVLSYHETCFL